MRWDYLRKENQWYQGGVGAEGTSRGRTPEKERAMVGGSQSAGSKDQRQDGKVGCTRKQPQGGIYKRAISDTTNREEEGRERKREKAQVCQDLLPLQMKSRFFCWLVY